MKAAIIIEHVEREYLFALILKKYLNSVGTSVIIAHAISDFRLVKTFEPELVFLPYFYRVDDFSTSPFLEIKSVKLFLSLSWEQFFNEVQYSSKVPKSIPSNLIILCWSNSWASSLSHMGFSLENIRQIGHPMWSILWQLPPAQANNNLFVLKKKIYFENLKWLDTSSKHVRALNISDAELSKLGELQRIVVETLRQLNLNNFKVKVRPSSTKQDLVSMRKLIPNANFVRGFPLIHYLKSSTHSFGEFSSSLIDSSLMQVPTYAIGLDRIPQILKFTWHDFFKPVNFIDGRKVDNLSEIDKVRLLSYLHKESILNANYFDDLWKLILSKGLHPNQSSIFEKISKRLMVYSNQLWRLLFSVKILRKNRSLVNSLVLDPSTHSQDFIGIVRDFVYRLYAHAIYRRIIH